MKILTFAMRLRRMTALTKVLMLCQRLGGTVTYLSAADRQANIVLAVPPEGAHRFAPQIRRVIDVLDLTELHALGGADAQRAEQRERLRHTA